MIDACTTDTPVVVLGFESGNPAPYGRLVLDGKGMLTRIVEAKDATPEEFAITLCNGGAMAVRREHLFRLLAKVTNDNASGEYYLPDVVGLARAEGLQCAVIRAAEEDLQGVNSRAELANVEAALQRRLRKVAMDDGATMLDPETVYMSFDTVLGRDVTVGRNIVFGPGVSSPTGQPSRRFHIEGATIAEGAEINPFARIRPKRNRPQGKSAISSRQKRRRSRKAPRSAIFPISAMRASAPMPISARAQSPAIMTAITSSSPTSAQAPLSVPILRLSHRSR